MSGLKIMGKAPDGTAQPITLVQDTNGDYVLRVVDASPFSYDEPTDTLKIKPKKSVPAVQTLSETVSIAASGTKVWTIQPPAGQVWDISHIGLDIPLAAGSTSGTQVVQVFMGANSSNLNQILEISSVFGTKIVIRGNVPFTKTNCTPTSDTDFINALKHLKLSYECPLVVVYTNLTNATQAGTLGFKISKLIEYVD